MIAPHPDDPACEPLVTVIVPCYNYGHLLPETLASIARQTYRNWECIVVNDGSPDDTEAVATSHATADPRFRLVTQDNAGLAAARNVGLRRAAGAYIQFLDADDLLERRKLELQVAFLQYHPEIDVVYGNVTFFPDDVARLYGFSSFQVLRLPAGPREALRALTVTNVPVNAPLVRRRVVAAVGEFDLRLSQVADWDYWYRCALRGATFHYLDTAETRALVRIHPASMSRSLKAVKDETLRFREKLGQAVSDRELRELNAYRALIDRSFWALAEIATGDRWLGMRRLMASAGRLPGLRERIKWLCSGALAPLVPPERLQSLPFEPLGATIVQLARGRIGRTPPAV